MILYYFWIMSFCWVLKGSIKIRENLVITVKNGNLKKEYLVY